MSKTWDEMTLDEKADWVTALIIMAIERGLSIRAEVVSVIMLEAKSAYRRGQESGRKSKQKVC